MDFPIRLTSQLREHLRALRKARGLTQAGLGQLLGVGQARVAEIESNPGAVSVEQLLKVLSALRSSMVLRDDLLDMDAAPKTNSRTARRDAASLRAAERLSAARQGANRPPANTPSTGEWRLQPLRTGSRRRQPAPVLASRHDAATPSDAQALRAANPDAHVTPTSRRNFVIRPKKGSW